MNDILQINKTIINIGLKKEYKFFQVSDTHIAYIDEKSSDIDINDNQRSKEGWNILKRDFAKQFNEFCDERYDVEAHLLFDMLAQHALQIGADALILSGDVMDRVTDSNIRYLKEYFSTYPIKVIYCPGNHATHDEFGAHRNMYDRFKGLIDSPEFDVFDFGEFRVVTIDNGNKKITKNQIDRFNQELLKKGKILLVLHAPIKLGEFGEVMGKKIGRYFLLGSEGDDDNAFELVRLIKENDDKLIAILAGHIHTSVEYPVTENLVQYTTSSGLIGYGREIIIK